MTAITYIIRDLFKGPDELMADMQRIGIPIAFNPATGGIQLTQRGVLTRYDRDVDAPFGKFVFEPEYDPSVIDVECRVVEETKMLT